MIPSIQNVQTALAKLKEMHDSAAAAKASSSGSSSASNNNAGASSGASQNTYKPTGHSHVPVADSVTISVRAKRLSQMHARKSAGAEATGEKNGASQEKAAALKGFLSFIVEEHGNTGNPLPGNRKEESNQGNAASDTPSAGPNTASIGKDQVKAAEANEGSEGTPKASVRMTSVEKTVSPVGMNPPDQSADAPAVFGQTDQTEKKIGYLGENPGQGEDATPLRKIVQEIKGEAGDAPLNLDGLNRSQEQSGQITTPLEKMAENMKKNSPLNEAVDLLSETGDKLYGKIDKTAEKVEKAAEKVAQKAEKEAEKLSEKAEKDSEKPEKAAEEIAEKPRKKVHTREIVRDAQAIKERHQTKARTQQADEDEEPGPRLEERTLHDEKLSGNRGSDDANEKVFSNYGLETFGPYFPGISDRVAAPEQPTAGQSIGRLKGVIHVNNQAVLPSAAAERNQVSYSFRLDTSASTPGHFSTVGRGNDSSVRGLFDMRRGIMAYQSKVEIFG